MAQHSRRLQPTGQVTRGEMGTDTVEFSTRQVKDIRDEDGQPMADKEADHSTVKLVAELD